jgi:multidrug efflux system outer membrane protein
MRNRSQVRFRIQYAGIAAAIVMLSGCSVGPNYHRPPVQAPTVFHGSAESEQSETQNASFSDLPWWQVFHDPQLQELIRTALKQNYDLQLAIERVIAARAQLGITRSYQFPAVSLDPNFSGGKTAEGIKSNIFSLAGDVVFQVDLFGRYRRATEASRAQLLGTQDAQQTVILTLVSDVASDYFLLRDLDLQLQITKETVRTQEDSVRLTQMRLQHGVGTRLDVLQARQVLDTANAQIPDLERQIGQTEDAINILLGKYPDNVPRGQPLGIETPSGWTWSETLPPQLPTGLPSELLERRPDIREAEQNLVAANANIGVAKAMFFPQISLLGSGGAAFGHSQFNGSNIPAPLGIGTYTAAASQPIFEGGALRNNLRYAKSQDRQALIGYQQTIQRAFGDVSDALIGYDKYHGVRERQEQSVKDLQESVDLSMMRYEGGTANYLEVLDSQRSLFSAELTLAQARNNEYQGLVQLYKALGGGWQ